MSARLSWAAKFEFRMKLRQIDILGFKSFRDRVTVSLSDGMTAIVGPNGCGKSNVVDALKWAMGDMSAKSLRGQSMEDVIFAGSEARRPMGMAEVTLTFENDGEWLGDDDAIDWGDAVPQEFRQMSEIAVTRRLHRTGESEYLINKTPCRLMDIQNLLAGTGVGKQGYSIIEQNRVGFIVSAKPQQRRGLIEEASGITRYKGQRDRAEKKLERTEENLLRVDDVLREVEKQIRTLERQAKKAAQHRALIDELRALEVALLVARRDELTSELELVEEKTTEAQTELERIRTIIEQQNKALEAVKVDAFAAEKKHADATESFYRLDTRLNLARSQVEHAGVSLQEANRRLGAAEREAAGQRTRIEELEVELTEVKAKLEGLSDLSEREEALQKQQTNLAERSRAAEDARNTRDAALRAIEEARSAIERANDRRQFFERRQTELAMREDALQTAVDESTKEAEKHRGVVGKLRTNVNELRERLGASKERESQLAKLRDDQARSRDEAQQNLAEAKARLADAQTRTGALRDVLARGDSFSPALRQVLELGAGLDTVHGTLADALVVDADAEQAVANLLENRVFDVLVDDLDVARALLEQLDEIEGRVSFQALDGVAVDDFVMALVAELDDDARTSGRVMTSAGRLVAGTSSSQTVLEQRRQLAELEALTEREEAAANDAQTAHENAVEQWRQTQQRADLARRETETLSLELRSREQELQIEERQLERVDRALESARAEIVPILRSRDELIGEREENEAKLEASTVKLEESRAAFDAIGTTDETMRAEVEQLRSDVTEAKIAFAEARERRRSLDEARVRTERGLESAKVLLQKYVAEQNQLSERIVELQQTIKNGEAELSGAEKQRDEAKKSSDTARSSLDAANKQVAEIESKLRERRSELERLAEGRQQLEFRAREVAMSVAHIDEQLRERYELELDVARVMVDAIKTSPAERRGKRDYLKRRIESLGPVNAMAEEEFEAAKERNSFLTEQREDLQAAIADLRQAIARMDKESRRRFKETFDAVNAKFKTIFPELFRGGRAELVLTEPDDLLNTGVEIHVQPPGKRLQSMTLLSGGEKALTAVSLIFSIFLLKPTPFSILDEVDAPLDEANVGRFSRMVKRLSNTSQMIVITHARRTMEAADMLYGVTMEEAGVSKMVNVRLSELDEQLAS